MGAWVLFEPFPMLQVIPSDGDFQPFGLIENSISEKTGGIQTIPLGCCVRWSP